MGRSSQRHKREFYPTDSAEDTASDFGELPSNPSALNLIAPLPGAVTSGEAYSYTIYAVHGATPYAYTDDGGLPTGLTLNGTTGEVAGTTTETGSHPVVFTVTDDNGDTATATVTFVVS